MLLSTHCMHVQQEGLSVESQPPDANSCVRYVSGRGLGSGRTGLYGSGEVGPQVNTFEQVHV